MPNKINFSIVLFFLVISLFLACDKDNVNKEFGQYAVAVTYNGDDFLELHFVIDGKECGKFAPAPKVNPSYIEDCSSLKNPNNLINIFVLKKITPGEHTLEVKNEAGNLIKTLEFEMLHKECIFQDMNIAFH